MGASFTPELKKMLLEAGCYLERQGKGDHEIWYSPIADRRFVVDVTPYRQRSFKTSRITQSLLIA